MEVVNVLIKILSVILLTDFVTGIMHFWMDQYGREDMPFVGKHVVEINIVHHRDPRHMTLLGYWKLTYTSWMFGGILLLLEWLILGGVGWGGIFLVVYGSQANLIHKWAHQTPQENGKIVTWLQNMHLIQSPPHHGVHHKAPFDMQFCILTDWLNPILEKTHFWYGVIRFFKFFGIQPVAGSDIRKNV